MMKKKVLSLLLAVCLVVGMLPVAASAAGSVFRIPIGHTIMCNGQQKKAGSLVWVGDDMPPKDVLLALSS